MMEPQKTRLIIADPSLVDARGHHFSLTKQLTRGAHLLGIETIWLTHIDFIAPSWLQHVKVYPIFSATMYYRYDPKEKDKLSAKPSKTLLNELLDSFERADVHANDHVYFHTGFGDLYQAIPSYISLLDKRQLPYLHICTPYDLDAMPGKDSKDVLVNIFSGMRLESAVDKKIFFWAETPQLALHYTLTYGFNVRAMPLPPPEFDCIEKSNEESDVFTALYLGAAREEKGFLELPGIVERLYETHGRTGKIKFVIQCSPQIIGYLPKIKLAIEKLSIFPESYVKLINTVLSEDDYHSYLMCSDVLLLLYNKNSYRIRGSGIAVEAISFGKSILTYKNTFCASLITHDGGAIVEGNDEAIAMLIHMAENKHTFSQKAELQGEEYRNKNSVENYVSKIIRQPKHDFLPPFYPSAVVGHISPSLIRL